MSGDAGDESGDGDVGGAAPPFSVRARVVTAQPIAAQQEPSSSRARLRRGSHRLAAVTARGTGGCLALQRWVSGSSTPLGFVMSASSTAPFLVGISMSAELASSN
eukprot:scaffold43380_cov66-Phaeocystis_antarctica.AAC.9